MVYELEIQEDDFAELEAPAGCGLCGCDEMTTWVEVKTGLLDEGARESLALPSCASCASNYKQAKFMSILLFLALFLPVCGGNIRLGEQISATDTVPIILFCLWVVLCLIVLSWLWLRFDPVPVRLIRCSKHLVLSLRSEEAAQLIAEHNHLRVKPTSRFRSNA